MTAWRSSSPPAAPPARRRLGCRRFVAVIASLGFLFAGLTARSVSAAPAPTTGYWLAAADGGVFSYGSAIYYGSATNVHLNAPILDMDAAPDGKGYWLAAGDGGVFAFGSAKFYGSAANLPLNAPIMGIAGTPDGKGYWLVASDGGVFNFGSAGFFGSMGSSKLQAPVYAMAAAPDGKGYWLAAADGGVFAFGSAKFYGAPAGLPLHAPIMDIDVAPDGKGYWLVAADGGVFTYGSAGFFGSAHGLPLNGEIVGVTSTADGKGHWLAAADGGVFAYGSATFQGGATGLPLNDQVVAVTLATPPVAPKFTSGLATTFVAGSPNSFTFTASGVPAATFSAVGSLPSGVTLSSGGVLSGQPALGTFGDYPLVVTASNSTASVDIEFTLSVIQAPMAFTAAKPPRGDEEKSYKYQFAADGWPVPTFAVVSGTLPNGLKLAGDGTLSGTPTKEGCFKFVVRASNAAGFVDTKTLTVEIEG